MKIHTRLVWDRNGELLHDDWLAYEGPVAHADGGSSKSSQNSIAQTSTGPWSAQQPYLTQGFSDALKNYQSGSPQYYPDSTVTPYSDQTRQGMGLMQGIADSSSLPQSAANAAQTTINGNYVGNPGAALGNNPAAYAMNPFTNALASVTGNPNANVMANVTGNPNANVRADTSTNPNLDATSNLATNSNINAFNQNAGAFNPYAGVSANTPANANSNSFNPYAGVANSYMSQNPNSYIGNVTRGISRSIIPQVTSQFAMAGRTGDSPIAQQAIAKGIADAVAPYQFSSAEANQNRLFQGGAQQQQNLYNAGATLSGQQYNSGQDLAQRQQTAAENQANRLYGSGATLAGQMYNSGATLAGQQYQGGESQAARAQGINDALAQRQYAGGESYANRNQTAADAQAARQFESGGALAQGLNAASANQAANQFASGQSLANALNAASANQTQNQFNSGADLTNRMYGAGESALSRGLTDYTNERNNQLNQVNNAGSTYQNTLAPANTLLNVGAMNEDKSAQNLQDQISRFNYNQNLPNQKLNDFMSQISGNYGQAGTNVSNATGTSSYQQPFMQTFSQFGQGLGGMTKGLGK